MKALLAAALAASACASFAQTVHLVDVSDPAWAFSEGIGVNSSGQLAIDADDQDFNSIAASWSGGVSHRLNDSGTFTAQVAQMNEGGTIIGSDNGHAVYWTGTTEHDLGTFGGTYSQGLGINNLGDMTGGADTASGQHHAYLYSGGSMIDIGTLGGNISYGGGINDFGQIAGASEVTPGAHDFRAFVYSNGSMHALANAAGTFANEATAISNSGDVAGYGFTASQNADNHAVMWHGGIGTDLGTLGGANSYASALNDFQMVVGSSDTATFDEHGFIYFGGAMHDLNDLLDSSGAGYTISGAFAITDNGYIAARGDDANGVGHAVLLRVSGVPEPGTMAVLGIGALALLRRRRRSA